MNIPQIFLLFASLYYWIKFLTDPDSKPLYVLSFSLALFVTAIFFKEAFVFHTAFMFFLLLHEKKLQLIPFKRKAVAFLPFALLTAAYLVFRLYYLPVNPAYLPQRTLAFILKPLGIIGGIFGASFLLYFLLFIRGHIPLLRWVSSQWGYFVFLAAAALPYIAHPFFSFGWLYSMAPYCFLIFGLMLPESSLPAVKQRRTQLALSLFFLFSAGTVLVYLQHIDWRQWKPAQQNFIKAVESIEGEVTHVVIVDQSTNPSANFHRVIGNEFSVWHLWDLFHPPLQKVIITRNPSAGDPLNPSQRTILWSLDAVKVQT